MSTKLKQIYSIFSPSPLSPDQQDLYVDLEEVRGHTGIVRRLAQTIRLADDPTCQVLTGHRGSGKSTELMRLHQALEKPTDGAERLFVVQIQADDEMDRNDIDFPEILIAIVRQLAAQLREREQIELKPGYFKDRWQRLKDLAFSDVDIEKLDLIVGMAKLSGTIKNSLEARERVRKALDPDTNNWLAAANEVIGQAVLELSKKSYAGLVVIVDDLDKMITRPHGTAGCSTTEYLFVHRSEQLKGFRCHVIYTLPIELAYSHHESSIKQLYGGHLPVVPMTKLSTKPPKSKQYEPGLKRFRAIIDARLKAAGATENDLFDDGKTRDQLSKLTGGQPTELMSMIREAIVTDGLPIGAAGVTRCRTEAMRSYRRLLRADHWPLIEEIRRSGALLRTKENEAAFRELLDSRAILLYMNDEEWYVVNPAIDHLPAPAPAEIGKPAS